MVDVVYLVPGTGLADEERARREGVANELTVGNVTVESVDGGPSSIESCVEDTWSAVGLLQKLWEVREEYDAVAIGCFGDPGIRTTRELVDIPVGPSEATLHSAAQVALVQLADNPSGDRPEEPGTGPRTGSQRQTRQRSVRRRPGREYQPRLGATRRENGRNRATGRRGGRRRGAHSGCTSLAFMQVHDVVADQVGVPLLDPATIVLEQAATWGRHGITQSKSTYPAPKYEKLDDLLGPVSPGPADD